MTRHITPHKGGRDARIPSGRIRQVTLDRILAEKRERKMSFADLVEERWQGDRVMDVQNEILDYLGSEATVEMLKSEYTGKSHKQIKADLDTMFPSDDNSDLAEKIYDYLN